MSNSDINLGLDYLPNWAPFGILGEALKLNFEIGINSKNNFDVKK